MTHKLTPDTKLKSWPIFSRIDGGQRWHIEHATNPSVTTLKELAAWGRPKQGQWRNFGKTKIDNWTAILAEAGLQWNGMAPAYPRGNPMHALVAPLTEDSEDIVYRLQVAIDSDWLGRFPLPQRGLLAEAISEIRTLRNNEERLRQEIDALQKAYA